MAIIASDVLKLLTVAAAAGYTTAGTPATSLGDQASTTVITDDQIGNLFDDVSGDEAVAGRVEYRALYVLNNHASLTLTNATVTVASQLTGGASITIAVDNIGVSAKGSGSAQGATIPDEITAPTGVGAFGAGPIALGDLPPGNGRMVWVKRTTPAGATSVNPDGFVLDIDGDTLP